MNEELGVNRLGDLRCEDACSSERSRHEEGSQNVTESPGLPDLPP
jgi:hypothetical protein